MILLAGLPDEPPLALVATALDDIGACFTMVDQRRHAEIGLCLVPAVGGGEVGGRLVLPDREIDLASVRGVYARLYGEQSFPELRARPSGDPVRRRFERLVTTFTTFADLCPGVVFNRSAGMSTNNSKGFQAQIIEACGFRVPRTLITNAPDRARAFVERLWASGGQAIYKSASSVRSIVRLVEPADLDRLNQLRICPVQFQERVGGVDYRVHVIGAATFATRIETTGTDYRYATREPGGSSQLSVATLPPDVRARCIRLAGELGIAFAGVDLRQTPDGEWVCFEVNPSPAFSYYEAHTGQPIALAVAHRLAAT